MTGDARRPSRPTGLRAACSRAVDRQHVVRACWAIRGTPLGPGGRGRDFEWLARRAHDALSGTVLLASWHCLLKRKHPRP